MGHFINLVCRFFGHKKGMMWGNFVPIIEEKSKKY